MGQKKSKSEGASKSKEPSNPLFVSGSTEESKPQAKETAPAAKETPKPRFLGPGWDKRTSKPTHLDVSLDCATNLL